MTLQNIAVTYGDLSDYGKEAELEEKLYALRCKTLGEEHPDTLRALNNLAWTEDQLGNRERAFALQEKVYTLRAKVLGADHPHTVKSKERLEEYREKLNAQNTAESSSANKKTSFFHRLFKKKQ
jgi:hypothetical protein